MEVGLVSIDFIGVATSALAAIEKIRLAEAELRKQVDRPYVFGSGIAGSGGGVAQSVESQVAPFRVASASRRQILSDEMVAQAAFEERVRAFSVARQKMLKDEAESNAVLSKQVLSEEQSRIASDATLTEAVSTGSKRRVVVTQEEIAALAKAHAESEAELTAITTSWESGLDSQLAAAKLNANEIVRVETEKVAKLDALNSELERSNQRVAAESRIQSSVAGYGGYQFPEGTSVPWTPPSIATSSAEGNIGEAERAGGGLIPIPLPSKGTPEYYDQKVREQQEAIQWLKDAKRRAGLLEEEGGGLRPYYKLYGARAALRGASNFDAGDMFGSGLSAGSSMLTNVAPLGMMGGPWGVAAAGGAVAGAGSLGWLYEVSKYGGDFETAVKNMATQTNLATDAEKKRGDYVGQAVRDLASYIKDVLSPQPGVKSSPTESVSAATLLINSLQPELDRQMKEKPEETKKALMDMLDTLFTFAIAAKKPVQDAVEDLKKTFNGIGFSMQDGPIKAAKEFQRVANDLATGATKSQLQLDEVGNAMIKAAAVAHLYGMSLEETTAAVEVAAKVGAPGSDTGTQVRNILKYMSGVQASKKTIADVEGLGINFSQINPSTLNPATGKPQGFAAGLQTLYDALQKLPPDEQARIVSEIFRTRSTATASVLLNNIPDILDITKAQQNGGNLQRMAAVQSSTFQAEGDALKNKIEGILIGAFDSDKFKDVLKDLSKLVDDIAQAEPLILLATDALIKLLDLVLKFANFALGPTPENPIKAAAQAGVDIAIPGLAPMKGALDVMRALKASKEAERYPLPPVPGGSHMEQVKGNATSFPGTDDQFQGNGGEDWGQANLDFWKDTRPNPNDYGTTADYNLSLRYWKARQKGHQDGGHTGHGRDTDVAGYVHANEYVLDAPTVRRVGLNRVKALHKRLKGYDGGGLATPVPLSDFRTEPIDQPEPELPTGLLPTIPIAGESDGDSTGSGILSLLSAIGGALPGKTDLMGGRVGTASAANSIMDLAKGFDPLNSDFSNIMSGKAGIGGNISGASVLSGMVGSAGSIMSALTHKDPMTQYNWDGSKKKAPEYSELGAVAGAALPMIANILLPGSGAILSPVLNSLGVNATGQTGSLNDPSNMLSMLGGAAGFFGLQSGGYAGHDYSSPSTDMLGLGDMLGGGGSARSSADMSGVHERLDKLISAMDKPQRSYVTTGDIYGGGLVGQQQQEFISL